MDGYLGNFFEHSGQIVSFVTAAAVWVALSALGALVAGRNRFQEATPLYGWAMVSLVFTTVGAFTPVPFTPLAAGLGLLALFSCAVLLPRGDRILPPGSLKMAVLFGPLILLVSAMAASQWDEFSNWLINAWLLLNLDGFPDNTNKHLGGGLAAYPYGWSLMTYLASRLAGRLVENAGALLNVFLLLTFGLVAVKMIKEGLGEKTQTSAPGWGLLALGGLAATLLNPTFAQKVVLTAYADTATAVFLGFGGVLGWFMLAALERGENREAQRLAFQMGLVLLALVNLKQVAVVLFALVVGAVLLAGLRDPAIRLKDLAKTVPAMIIPGLVIYGVWRYYVSTALTGQEFSLRPFDQWYIDLIPQILWSMLVVLAKKGAYFALMIVASGFAVRGLVRFRTPFDRLAVIVGAVFLGYNAFLLFAYVATFGKFDALRVASLWRYNMHLGPLAVAFAAYGLACLWKERAPVGLKAMRLDWLPVVLILAAPLVFTHKLRFDKHPPVPFYRAVGAEVAELLKPDDRLFVLDPTGSGQSAVITRFEIKGLANFSGYAGSYHPKTLAHFRSILRDRDTTHVLAHSSTPEMRQALGRDLQDRVSYLLRSDGRGGWQVQYTWKRP
jgi:hypothetical protein